MKKITVAYLRDLQKQVSEEDITYSRMVELLNEKANNNDIIIYRTLWRNKDVNKQDNVTHGFIPPFVCFPESMPIELCSKSCIEVLKNDTYECYGIIAERLIDGSKWFDVEFKLKQ